MYLSMCSLMRWLSRGGVLNLKEQVSANLSSICCRNTSQFSYRPTIRQKYLCSPAGLNNFSSSGSSIFSSVCLSSEIVVNLASGRLLPQKQQLIQSFSSSYLAINHPNIFSMNVILKLSRLISQRDKTFRSRKALGPAQAITALRSTRGYAILVVLLRSISAVISSIARQTSSLLILEGNSLAYMQCSSCCLMSQRMTEGAASNYSVSIMRLRQM